MPSTVLVWLRRDLRLTDNPALLAACKTAERIIPVYIHAPEEDGPWPAGAASRWWLHRSLAALGARLQNRGAPLVIRQGRSLDELRLLAKQTGAARVTWNRLYEPAAIARDTMIKSALREDGIAADSFNGSLLYEPWQQRTQQGQPYKVFTPFWRSCLRELDRSPPPCAAPTRLNGGNAIESLPLKALELLPAIPWDAGMQSSWQPGEEAALRQLEVFSARNIAHYQDSRNRPDQGGTSRLSPCLHFGELGPRQIVAQLRSGAADTRDTHGTETFLREIGWRETGSYIRRWIPELSALPDKWIHRPWAAPAGILAAAGVEMGRTYPLPIVDLKLSRDTALQGYAQIRTA